MAQALVEDAWPPAVGTAVLVRGLFWATVITLLVVMAGRRVDIFLAPAGADGAGAVTIGHSVTDANGEFSARAEVPAALDVGDYEVYASFRGDERAITHLVMSINIFQHDNCVINEHTHGEG